MKKSRLLGALCVGITLVISMPVSAVTINVNNQFSGAQNLLITSIGATTSFTVSLGNYVGGGDIGVSGQYARPVVPFLNSDFAPLIGGSLSSAQLQFSTTFDFTEPGDSQTMAVRLFSTTETGLTIANKDIFAAITGTGGNHVEIGSFVHQDGVFGNWSIDFGASDLLSLAGMINSSDTVIGISFIETFGNDRLDEVVFGRNLVLSVTGEVSAVPVPAAIWLFSTALIGLAGFRRKAVEVY